MTALARRVTPAPVEALYCQNLLIVELQGGAMSRFQTELTQDLGTEPFILDGVAQIQLHVAHQSDGQFENVRGGQAAMWAEPLPVLKKQRRLFLRARQRDSEVVCITIVGVPDIAAGHAATQRRQIGRASCRERV